MRVVAAISLFLLSACASQQLAPAPPIGVDFSGHWRLNIEESDDPLHLIQSQNIDPSKVTAGSQGAGGRGSRGGPAGGGFGDTAGPSVPSASALGDGLRWPGMEMDIKQVAGVVAISSAGLDRVYEPSNGDTKVRRLRQPPDGSGARDRDMPARDRDGPPPVCGWEDKTLVVRGGEPDDDHPPFDERYSLSPDGQRLIEVIGFKRGRSAGFTMSRVWDRVDATAQHQEKSRAKPGF